MKDWFVFNAIDRDGFYDHSIYVEADTEADAVCVVKNCRELVDVRVDYKLVDGVERLDDAVAWHAKLRLRGVDGAELTDIVTHRDHSKPLLLIPIQGLPGHVTARRWHQKVAPGIYRLTISSGDVPDNRLSQLVVGSVPWVIYEYEYDLGFAANESFSLSGVSIIPEGNRDSYVRTIEKHALAWLSTQLDHRINNLQTLYSSIVHKLEQGDH